MLALLFDGSQRQSEVGWGWLKIWGQGVILAEGKSYLFSPVQDKRDHPNNCVEQVRKK